MFLPIGDTPNARNYVPYVTWALIAANVAVFALVTLPLSLQAVDPTDPLVWEYLRRLAPELPRGIAPSRLLSELDAYQLYVWEHGYKPGLPSVADLFYSMFLHGGLLHLVGNMLFLYIYGDNVEHRLGRLPFLAAYLVTGALATLAFSLLAGDSVVPLVGASGAISGVLGLYFILFPRNQVKIFIFLFPFLVDVWLLPARLVLGAYLVLDNLLPILISSGSSGVAHGAHIGGFVAGVLGALIGERLAWRQPWAERAVRLGRPSGRPAPARGWVGGGAGVPVTPWPASPAGRAGAEDDGFMPGRGPRPGSDDRLFLLRQALARDERAVALDWLLQLDRAELAELRPEECGRLARWLDERGHPSSAQRLLVQCLGLQRSPADRARAYLALGELRLAQGQPASAFQHLLAALDLDPDPETAQRVRSALARIELHRRLRPVDP